MLVLTHFMVKIWCYVYDISAIVTLRDLLLRDNLFEIITSFRTFYIQVETRLPFRKVFAVSSPACFQVYPSPVVVSQRSAAEVLQRTAVQSYAKFVFAIHTQPSVTITTLSCS